MAKRKKDSFDDEQPEKKPGKKPGKPSQDDLTPSFPVPSNAPAWPMSTNPAPRLPPANPNTLPGVGVPPTITVIPPKKTRPSLADPLAVNPRPPAEITPPMPTAPQNRGKQERPADWWAAKDTSAPSIGDANVLTNAQGVSTLHLIQPNTPDTNPGQIAQAASMANPLNSWSGLGLSKQGEGAMRNIGILNPRELALDLSPTGGEDGFSQIADLGPAALRSHAEALSVKHSIPFEMAEHAVDQTHRIVTSQTFEANRRQSELIDLGNEKVDQVSSILSQTSAGRNYSVRSNAGAPANETPLQRARRLEKVQQVAASVTKYEGLSQQAFEQAQSHPLSDQINKKLSSLPNSPQAALRRIQKVVASYPVMSQEKQASYIQTIETDVSRAAPKHEDALPGILSRFQERQRKAEGHNSGISLVTAKIVDNAILGPSNDGSDEPMRGRALVFSGTEKQSNELMLTHDPHTNTLSMTPSKNTSGSYVIPSQAIYEGMKDDKINNPHFVGASQTALDIVASSAKKGVVKDNNGNFHDSVEMQPYEALKRAGAVLVSHDANENANHRSKAGMINIQDANSPTGAPSNDGKAQMLARVRGMAGKADYMIGRASNHATSVSARTSGVLRRTVDGVQQDSVVSVKRMKNLGSDSSAPVYDAVGGKKVIQSAGYRTDREEAASSGRIITKFIYPDNMFIDEGANLARPFLTATTTQRVAPATAEGLQEGMVFVSDRFHGPIDLKTKQAGSIEDYNAAMGTSHDNAGAVHIKSVRPGDDGQTLITSEIFPIRSANKEGEKGENYTVPEESLPLLPDGTRVDMIGAALKSKDIPMASLNIAKAIPTKELRQQFHDYVRDVDAGISNGDASHPATEAFTRFATANPGAYNAFSLLDQEGVLRPEAQEMFAHFATSLYFANGSMETTDRKQTVGNFSNNLLGRTLGHVQSEEFTGAPGSEWYDEKKEMAGDIAKRATAAFHENRAGDLFDIYSRSGANDVTLRGDTAAAVGVEDGMSYKALENVTFSLPVKDDRGRTKLVQTDDRNNENAVASFSYTTPRFRQTSLQVSRGVSQGTTVTVKPEAAIQIEHINDGISATFTDMRRTGYGATNELNMLRSLYANVDDGAYENLINSGQYHEVDQEDMDRINGFADKSEIDREKYPFAGEGAVDDRNVQKEMAYDRLVAGLAVDRDQSLVLRNSKNEDVILPSPQSLKGTLVAGEDSPAAKFMQYFKVRSAAGDNVNAPETQERLDRLLGDTLLATNDYMQQKGVVESALSIKMPAIGGVAIPNRAIPENSVVMRKKAYADAVGMTVEELDQWRKDNPDSPLQAAMRRAPAASPHDSMMSANVNFVEDDPDNYAYKDMVLQGNDAAVNPEFGQAQQMDFDGDRLQIFVPMFKNKETGEVYRQDLNVMTPAEIHAAASAKSGDEKAALVEKAKDRVSLAKQIAGAAAAVEKTWNAPEDLADAAKKENIDDAHMIGQSYNAFHRRAYIGSMLEAQKQIDNATTPEGHEIATQRKEALNISLSQMAQQSYQGLLDRDMADDPHLKRVMSALSTSQLSGVFDKDTQSLGLWTGYGVGDNKNKAQSFGNATRGIVGEMIRRGSSKDELADLDDYKRRQGKSDVLALMPQHMIDKHIEAGTLDQTLDKGAELLFGIRQSKYNAHNPMGSEEQGLALLNHLTGENIQQSNANAAWEAYATGQQYSRKTDAKGGVSHAKSKGTMSAFQRLILGGATSRARPELEKVDAEGKPNGKFDAGFWPNGGIRASIRNLVTADTSPIHNPELKETEEALGRAKDIKDNIVDLKGGVTGAIQALGRSATKTGRAILESLGMTPESVTDLGDRMNAFMGGLPRSETFESIQSQAKSARESALEQQANSGSDDSEDYGGGIQHDYDDMPVYDEQAEYQKNLAPAPMPLEDIAPAPVEPIAQETSGITVIQNQEPSALVDEAAIQPKRGRGRPKGSKNKPKGDAVAEMPAASAVTTTAPVSVESSVSPAMVSPAGVKSSSRPVNSEASSGAEDGYSGGRGGRGGGNIGAPPPLDDDPMGGYHPDDDHGSSDLGGTGSPVRSPRPQRSDIAASTGGGVSDEQIGTLGRVISYSVNQSAQEMIKSGALRPLPQAKTQAQTGEAQLRLKELRDDLEHARQTGQFQDPSSFSDRFATISQHVNSMNTRADAGQDSADDIDWAKRGASSLGASFSAFRAEYKETEINGQNADEVLALQAHNQDRSQRRHSTSLSPLDAAEVVRHSESPELGDIIADAHELIPQDGGKIGASRLKRIKQALETVDQRGALSHRIAGHRAKSGAFTSPSQVEFNEDIDTTIYSSAGEINALRATVESAERDKDNMVYDDSEKPELDSLGNRTTGQINRYMAQPSPFDRVASAHIAANLNVNPTPVSIAKAQHDTVSASISDLDKQYTLAQKVVDADKNKTAQVSPEHLQWAQSIIAGHAENESIINESRNLIDSKDVEVIKPPKEREAKPAPDLSANRASAINDQLKSMGGMDESLAKTIEQMKQFSKVAGETGKSVENLTQVHKNQMQTVDALVGEYDSLQKQANYLKEQQGKGVDIDKDGARGSEIIKAADESRAASGDTIGQLKILQTRLARKDGSVEVDDSPQPIDFGGLLMDRTKKGAKWREAALKRGEYDDGIETFGRTFGLSKDAFGGQGANINRAAAEFAGGVGRGALNVASAETIRMGRMINSVLINPAMGAAKDYEKSAADTAMLVRRSGQMSGDEFNASASGHIMSREGRRELAHRRFGEQSYSLYSGVMDVMASPGMAGGAVGTAAVLAGPAAQGAMLGYQLGGHSMSAGLLGGVATGIGALALYSHGNRENWRDQGSFNTGGFFGREANTLNWVTGATGRDDADKQYAKSGMSPLFNQAVKMLSEGYTLKEAGQLSGDVGATVFGLGAQRHEVGKTWTYAELTSGLYTQLKDEQSAKGYTEGETSQSIAEWNANNRDLISKTGTVQSSDVATLNEARRYGIKTEDYLSTKKAAMGVASYNLAASSSLFTQMEKSIASNINYNAAGLQVGMERETDANQLLTSVNATRRVAGMGNLGASALAQYQDVGVANASAAANTFQWAAQRQIGSPWTAGVIESSAMAALNRGDLKANAQIVGSQDFSGQVVANSMRYGQSQKDITALSEGVQKVWATDASLKQRGDGAAVNVASFMAMTGGNSDFIKTSKTAAKIIDPSAKKTNTFSEESILQMIESGTIAGSVSPDLQKGIQNAANANRDSVQSTQGAIDAYSNQSFAGSVWDASTTLEYLKAKPEVSDQHSANVAAAKSLFEKQSSSIKSHAFDGEKSGFSDEMIGASIDYNLTAEGKKITSGVNFLSDAGIDTGSVVTARLGAKGITATTDTMQSEALLLKEEMLNGVFDEDSAKKIAVESAQQARDKGITDSERLAGTSRSLTSAQQLQRVMRGDVDTASISVRQGQAQMAMAQDGFSQATQSVQDSIFNNAFTDPATAMRQQSQLQQTQGMYQQYTKYGMDGNKAGLLLGQASKDLSQKDFSVFAAASGGDRLTLTQLAQQGIKDAKYATMDLQTGADAYQYGISNTERGNIGAYANQHGLLDMLGSQEMMSGGVRGMQEQQRKLGVNLNIAQHVQQVAQEAISYQTQTGGAETLDSRGFAQGGDGLAMLSRRFASQGRTLNVGNGMGMWQIEDAGVKMGREKTAFSMGQQEQQMAMGNKQFDLEGKHYYEKYALNQEQMQYNRGQSRIEMTAGRTQSLKSRVWQQEDMSFSRNQSELNFGWQMEDSDRNIKYARGRERLDLIRQKDRAVISHSMDMGQMDKQKSRFEDSAKFEDEKFAREKVNFEKSIEFQDKEIALQKLQFEEGRKMDGQKLQMQREAFEKEKTWLKESYDLEDQRRLLDRQNAQLGHDMQTKMTDLVFQTQEQIRHLSEATQLANEALAAQITQQQLDAQTGKLMAETAADLGIQAGIAAGIIPQMTKAISDLIANMSQFANHTTTTTTPTSPAATTSATRDRSGVIVINSGSTGHARQFANGGYTGDGGRYEPAGIVHKGEYVVPQNGAMVSKDPETNEKLDTIANLLGQIVKMGPGRVDAQIHMPGGQTVGTGDIISQSQKAFGQLRK